MAACRMSEIVHQHTPVLLKESVDALITNNAGIYVDATFGRGSHSAAILKQLNASGRLIAFDQDPEAITYAKANFTQDHRFTIYHQSFAALQPVLESLGFLGKVNGILFDLGVSSPQLDNPERGFSFLRTGKLDMRMNTSQGIDAMTWLQKIDETTLANILWKYGEEKFSRRIARLIVATRETSPITTTTQLADIVRQAMPKQMKFPEKHVATRTFQAIRIAINQELEALEAGLTQALDALTVGGHLVVISFHSLEDRIVKQFIKKLERGVELPRGLPIKGERFAARLKTIGKPIKASTEEVNLNPRARSAILRIAEKVS